MPYRHIFNSVFTLDSEIAGAILLAVLALMGLSFHLSRRRKKPARRHEWSLVEGLYTLGVALMAVFLVWLSVTNNTKISAFDRKRPQLVVRVVAFQWCWRFQYVHEDVTSTGTCRGGHDLPKLYVPTGEVVRFDVTSQDVVHEFWIPYLRMKIQAFPDHVNGFNAEFVQKGEWPGRCAEFCGLYHSFMEFTLKVVSQTTFRHWLASHRGTIANTGIPAQ